MGNMLIKRVLRALLTLAITVVVVFILIRSVPGDPAELMAGGEATEEQIEEIRVAWGLNKPMIEQFGIYVSKLIRGDLGVSYQYMVGGKASTPVISLISARLPRTILLALCVTAFGSLVAIPLGVITALKPNSWLDNALTSFSLILTSFPGFYIAMVFILLFSLRLGWLPTGGYGSVKTMILPTLSLSMHFIAAVSRVTRTEVGLVMNSDYVRTAKAKGIPYIGVLFKHALRNAIIPIITTIGMRFSKNVTGAVYIESLFRYYGLGELLISSVNSRDYPTIQALIPYTALMFIICNIIVDMLYAVVDPRIRNK